MIHSSGQEAGDKVGSWIQDSMFTAEPVIQKRGRGGPRGSGNKAKIMPKLDLVYQSLCSML